MEVKVLRETGTEVRLLSGRCSIKLWCGFDYHFKSMCYFKLNLHFEIMRNITNKTDTPSQTFHPIRKLHTHSLSRYASVDAQKNLKPSVKQKQIKNNLNDRNKKLCNSKNFLHITTIHDFFRSRTKDLYATTSI